MAGAILLQCDGSLERAITYRKRDSFPGCFLDQSHHFGTIITGNSFSVDLEKLVSKTKSSHCSGGVACNKRDKDTFVDMLDAYTDLPIIVLAQNYWTYSLLYFCTENTHVFTTSNRCHNNTSTCSTRSNSRRSNDLMTNMFGHDRFDVLMTDIKTHELP